MDSAPPPEHDRVPIRRWVAPVLLLTAAGLLPWTLYLTYSLPSRHVTQHYDLAWVGFDIALFSAFAVTTRPRRRLGHRRQPVALLLEQA